MVFLILYPQNRDSAAIQVKLDELIRVSTAHNSFVIDTSPDELIRDNATPCGSRESR
jgi:low affinity Fe/Cu permease